MGGFPETASVEAVGGQRRLPTGAEDFPCQRRPERNDDGYCVQTSHERRWDAVEYSVLGKKGTASLAVKAGETMLSVWSKYAS